MSKSGKSLEERIETLDKRIAKAEALPAEQQHEAHLQMMKFSSQRLARQL